MTQDVWNPLQPRITVQPRSRIVAAGLNAAFMVLVNPVCIPGWQWQRRPYGAKAWTDLNDGGGYRGSRTPTLMISGTTLLMSGDQFRCVISGAFGAITSSSAELTVLAVEVTTLAGVPGWSGGGDGPGNFAFFSSPCGVAVDRAGNVYVGDRGNMTIRQVNPTNWVSTIAGAVGCSPHLDGLGTNAHFWSPEGIAVDNSSNVFVADQIGHTIRKVTPDGWVSTPAGLANSFGGVDGVGSTARFSYPKGVAVDNASNVFVADAGNHTIRKLALIGTNWVVTTVAGQAGKWGSADGNHTDARFNNPAGIAVDSTGNIYVADSRNHTIRNLSVKSRVSTLAGLAGSPGSADGVGEEARFNYPCGLVVSPSGTIFVADTENHTVRRVSPAGEVCTLAGSPGCNDWADGVNANARFSYPFGIALDKQGNLYVGDTWNNVIRKIRFLQPEFVPKPATLSSW